MADTILAIFVGLAVIVLSFLSILQRQTWHAVAAIIVGVIAVSLIGVQAWRAHQTQENVQTELRNIRTAANLILAGMKNEGAAPRPVAAPTTSVTKRDSDIANLLGNLRHAGRKRYLEWLAGYPDAEQKAEEWRLQVASILEKNYGSAINSRFNEPKATEAVGISVPGGTALVFSKAIEHGYRVDRLGDIIEDIIAGKISSRQ